MATMSTPLLILLAIHIHLSISHSQEIPTECKYESDRRMLICECNMTDALPVRESHCRLPEDVRLRITEYSIEILCAKPILSHKVFHWETFPGFNSKSIRYIEIDNCLLAENNTLSQIVKNFGINDLKVFRALNVKNSLHAQFFNECQDLYYLTLSENQITKLNENIFKSIGDLRFLDLSSNDLESLESGVFKYLKYLGKLDLNNNKLKRLSKDTFKGLSSLYGLRLSGNDLEILPNDVFTNLPELKYFTIGGRNNTCNISDGIFATNQYLTFFEITEIALEKIPDGFLSNLRSLMRTKIIESKVKYIPHDLLNGSVNIREFSLCGSRVRSLPPKLFADQSQMTKLELIDNELTELQDGLLADMEALEVLVLSDNRLTTISESTFRGLGNLRKIELKGNQLKTIHTDAFLHTKHLRVLNLENNQLSFILSAVISPHIFLSSLNSLCLSGNISLLKHEDLKFKNETMSIDLTGNEIRNVHFPSERSLIANENVIRLSLRNNPLISGCNTYDFLKYLNTYSDQDTVSVVDVDERFREWPRPTVKPRSSQLNLKDFTCAYFEIECPSHCQCRRRPIDNAFIFNCSNSALRVVPDIPNIDFELIVLDIHNNRLTELPKLGNNTLVAVIDASNNNINVIKFESLPPNLRYLDVSANRIQRLSSDVFHFLRICSGLALGKNPWLCCSSENKDLIAFVNEKSQSIIDLHEIKCEDQSVIVFGLSNEVVEGFCSNASTQLALVLLGSAFLICILCISTLYYKFQHLIKIWMYSHNLCLWCVDEEELDKDKAFDAFISYSHHDEDFAVDTIVNELENGTPSFKMCVHERDWLAGALISESIVESIANSRRTIIILSRNYLNSVWGQHEFHCAHGSAVTEKRIRVIIIIYGDIGDIELLDPTIKSYLKTNTYLEWGDKWFWKKLRYALTHKNLK